MVRSSVDRPGPLVGRTVGVTADRRGREQADLFRTRGAEVVHAPTMRTMDLTSDHALRAVTERLIADPPHWFVATTGMGVKYWVEAATGWGIEQALIAALDRVRIIARGPKATSALRKAGLEPEWRAPGETMAEVTDHLREAAVTDQRVAVQLFDPDSGAERSALATVAGEVTAVGVYRWRLPEDEAPVLDLCDRIAAGAVDAVTFTSQPAVRFLFRIARAHGRAEAVRAGMVGGSPAGTVLPVCIGPVCAEALAEAGIDDRIWPEPYRLVPMVKLTADRLTATAGRG